MTDPELLRSDVKQQIIRRLAAFAVLLATAGAARGVPANAGASLKTYTDSSHYVTFNYPASWGLSTKLSDFTSQAGALGITSGVTVGSPDSLALFGVGVKPSLSTASQERADAITLMKDGATVIGAITFTTLAPQYGPWLVAKAEVRFDAKHTGIELIEVADEGRKKTVYAVEILMRKPLAPDVEARQAAAVFNSLVVG